LTCGLDPRQDPPGRKEATPHPRHQVHCQPRLKATHTATNPTTKATYTTANTIAFPSPLVDASHAAGHQGHTRLRQARHAAMAFRFGLPIGASIYATGGQLQPRPVPKKQQQPKPYAAPQNGTGFQRVVSNNPRSCYIWATQQALRSYGSARAPKQRHRPLYASRVNSRYKRSGYVSSYPSQLPSPHRHETTSRDCPRTQLPSSAIS